MNSTVVKEFKTKAGLEAIVINVRGTHNNGYVLIGKDHKCYGKSYYTYSLDLDEAMNMSVLDFITLKKINDIQVHGGITYADKDIGDLIEVENTWIFGFDTAHSQDTKNPKSVGYVIEQCELLARQLQEIDND